MPVSSSGHLAIFQNIFHMNTDGGMLFDIMLHVGTLMAILVVYRKDIWRMIQETICICIDIVQNIKTFYYNKKYDEALRYKRVIHNNYRKFVVLVIVSTIPTAVIGYAMKSIVNLASRTLIVPGVCLLLTGVLLLVADISEDGKKLPKDVSYMNGFFIGIAQGFSTLPGLSRSGTTIAACLMSGMDKRFAVKYSFIMSIPAVVGAAVLELKDIGQGDDHRGFSRQLCGRCPGSGACGICLHQDDAGGRQKEKIQRFCNLLFYCGSGIHCGPFPCISTKGMQAWKCLH